MNVRTYSNDNELVNKRREEILAAAISLFIQKGYMKTTTREIASASNISIGTLYHYIGSKEDILQLLSSNLLSWTEKFISRLDEYHSLDPANKLRSVIDQYFKYVSENENLLLFLYQEAKNLKGEARKLFFKAEEMLSNLFITLLQEGIEGGDYKIQDINIMANNIIVMCDMWVFKRYFFKNKYKSQDFIKVQSDLILNSIRNAQPLA